METKEQIESIKDALFWLAKMSGGKTLEAERKNQFGYMEIVSVTQLVQMLDEGREIRIKIVAFPAPPESECWHNPGNLTPEQVGFGDGWRLLLASEVWSPRGVVPGVQMWFNHSWKGDQEGNGGFTCEYPSRTYRVKVAEHPVGSLKPVVALSHDLLAAEIADDIDTAIDNRPDNLSESQSIVQAIISGKIRNLEIKH